MLLPLGSISLAFNAFEAIQTRGSVAKEGEGMEIDPSRNGETRKLYVSRSHLSFWHRQA